MAAPKRKNGNEISVFFNMSLHQFMESNFFFLKTLDYYGNQIHYHNTDEVSLYSNLF